MKITHYIPSITLLFSILATPSCKRTENWETKIAAISTISQSEATATALFDIQKYSEYVDVGLYYGIEGSDNLEEWTLESKIDETGKKDFELSDLDAATTYSVQSFIKIKEGDYVYSSREIFTTATVPDPPCNPTSGTISFDGLNYSISNLGRYNPDGYYQLYANCDYGELNFTFLERPKSNIYTTKSGIYSQEEGTVEISGIFGGVFSCYYRASGDQEIYVYESDEGKISIGFCDIKMTTTQSCETYVYISGETHE